MNEIYKDVNFTVSYDKNRQLFKVTHEDSVSHQKNEITFYNPNRNFQVITFNPDVIDLEQAYEIFKHICEGSPLTSFVAMLDGMHLLTLDIKQLTQARDALTKIIDGKEE